RPPHLQSRTPGMFPRHHPPPALQRSAPHSPRYPRAQKCTQDLRRPSERQSAQHPQRHPSPSRPPGTSRLSRTGNRGLTMMREDVTNPTVFRGSAIVLRTHRSTPILRITLNLLALALMIFIIVQITNAFAGEF